MSNHYHAPRPTARMAAASGFEARPRTRSDFLTSLGDAARDNPVAAALIGTGVLWMLMGGRNSTIGSALENRTTGYVPISERRNSIGETVMQAARSAGSSLSHAADSTYQAVSDAAGRVGGMLSPSSSGDSEYAEGGYSEPLESARRYGANVVESSRQRLAEAFERQPLLLGAAGLAIGAGIAASLPVTRTERQVMGSASDYVHQQVSEAAAEAKDFAAAAAGEIKVQSQR